MAVRGGSCLVFILLAVSSYSSQCPRNNPSDQLSFRRPPAGVAYVREGQYKMIYCCATGYASMTWYKLFADGYSEYPWYVGDGNVLEEQGNQSLRIFQARKMKDSGWYKCVAMNDSHVIQHVVRLNVVECEIKNGRIDITQKPTGPIMAGIGERREIICEGNFGCLSGELSERTADWRYKYKNEADRWVKNNSRLTVIKYNKDNGTIVGSKLVIKSITTEDYHTDYICLLETPKVNSPTGFNVTIVPPETNRKLYWLFLLLVPVIAMVTCLILYCRYQQRIDYFYRSSCCGKLPEKGDVDNDMLLLYSDTDTKFVQQYFKPKFNEYTIVDKHRILPGHRELSELSESIGNSFAIVVIYTQAFLKDKGMCHVFDIAKSVPGTRIYIVLIEEIPYSILKKAPSIVTPFKWPWKDPENSRKVKNFYCALKKNLPRKQKLKQQDFESSSSCRPLLSSTSSTGNEVDVGMREPEVPHVRSPPTDIRVVTQTSQRSNDSGISSPSISTFNNEFPDIRSVSHPVVQIEIMV